MVTTPFYRLDIRSQRRQSGYGPMKKPNRKRDNVGLDTETYLGKVKLITDSFGRTLYFETDKEGFFLKPDVDMELLKFLFNYQYRGKFCYFWNIEYDFSSIIKVFDRDAIRDLYDTGELDYKGYHIDYLPGKYFEVRKDKHRSCFYDMTNFIATSLDYASTIYLKNQGKQKGIDGNLLNTNLGYWDLNKDKIIAYCKQDAKLTKDLADWFWDLVYDTLQLAPSQPYSKGAYAQEYFLSKCFVPRVQDLPNTPEMNVTYYFHQSYYGGRFELLQRGYFKHVYSYDIKSAYPSIIALLPDYGYGIWHHVYEFEPDTFYGVYFCTVHSENPIISPFMSKLFDINCYCHGNFDVYLTAPEVKFIIENFPGDTIDVIDGYIWEPRREVMYPFRNEVERLYRWKESENDENVRYVVKTFLNAIAGKFWQQIGGRTGKLYNPFYASYCSALTRLKLLKAALMVGPDNVIGFSTDAIHSTQPFNPPVIREDRLGDYVLDFKGEGVFIMSDIYTVWNEEKEKNRFRGKLLVTDETPGHRKNKSIKEILELMGENQTKWKYVCRRPVHLGEAVTRTGIDSINIFHDDIRTFDINGDMKRRWRKMFVSAEEALHEHHNSEPLVLGLG